MPERRVSVVIFEGGQSDSSVECVMGRVRRALVLDLIETLGAVEAIDDVIVGTNFEDLAGEAVAAGARVEMMDQSSFHFGRSLLEVVNSNGLSRVIYLGGAAMPLLGRGDWAAIARCLKTEDDIVIVNNVQSADLVAFTPASALGGIDLPPADNFLGWLLREHGLRRILLPNSGRANFDIDTPIDLEILKLQTRVPLGRRTEVALDSLDWDTGRLERAWNLLAVPDTEVALIGRVGPPVVTAMNAALRCRVRVFSEERGMKALGREERGEVVSLIGKFLDAVGPVQFFEYLQSVAEMVLIDSRVLMAHWKEPMTTADRFNSDLGLPEKVQNRRLREFTEAYMNAGFPVLCGGHNLISGGLWVMVEEITGPVPGMAETL